MVTFQLVIQLQMAKDRLDGGPSSTPAPKAWLHALSLLADQAHFRLGDFLACSPITAWPGPLDLPSIANNKLFGLECPKSTV